MPTINSKESLGELFGGKIASINYSFQTSSNPASATLTILSEENEFILPDFGELVSIPPFGLQMNVVEFTERKDSKKQVLQVELEEVSSQILDKELVLIYGIHSDLDYNLNNDNYTIIKGSLVPQSFYPENSIFNSFVKFPSLKKDFIKDFGNGVNLIGSSRATFVRRFPIQVTGVSDLPSENDQWITFTAGSLSPELSSYLGSFIYGENESGDIETKFGYTLYNLYKLIESKGIKFDESSEKFMSDESFFFSESGNIREVLSACLSKLGRSFYVDPLSQKIVVISNKDISQINTLLVNEFSNFTNTSAATQLSLTKSIRDVEANHFVLKGDLDSLNNSGNNKGGQQKPPRARKQKFYKLKDNFLSRGLNRDDVRLIELLAPLLYGVADEDTLDLFVYGLLKVSKSYNGTVYSKDEHCDFKEFVERERINRNQVVESNTPPWQKSWEQFEDADEEITLNGFFNYKNAIGAFEQFSKGDPKKAQPVIAASETNLYDMARNFLELWGGTYFSVAMTENQIQQKNFNSQAKFVGGLLNTFDFVPLKRDDLIAQVPEMQFLFNLLKWANDMSERDIKIDYTVGEIADFATQGALGSGDGDYVMLARRKFFQGVDIDAQEVEREMKQNFLSFDAPEDLKSFLMVTKNANSSVSSIIKKSEKAFERERKKVKDSLVAKYIKVDLDGDDNDSSGGGSEEDADILSLRNFQSNVKNFAKRTLTVIDGPIFETNLFLENINELNPQFEGPFVSTKVSYFRPPIIEDFQIDKGIQSISSSISAEGVTTQISYSSKKFAKVDKTFIVESLGTQRSELMKGSNPRAFIKNKLSE